MKLQYILLILIILLLLCIGNGNNRFKDSNKKESSKPKVQPIDLNVEGLPSLSEILESLELSKYLPRMGSLGVSDTRHLLRLLPMDYRMMIIDWDMKEFEVEKLKTKVDELLKVASITKTNVVVDNSERKLLKYGKFIIENSVQSYEYISASFGTYPPIGGYEIIVSEPYDGCEINANLNLTESIYIVKRGNCSFLTKATNAKKMNAKILLIVNNVDNLESPSSGHSIDSAITDKQLNYVKDLTIISTSNTTWSKFLFNSYNNLKSIGHVIPLKCHANGICNAVTDEEKMVQHEITSGKITFYNNYNEIYTTDYLTSVHGSALSLDILPLFISNPIDACVAIDKSNVITSKKFALLSYRGNCNFDIKAYNAQNIGASLLVILDIHDSPLQRIGGMQPLSGNIGIPSIIISAFSNSYVTKYQNNNITIELTLANDNKISDDWMEVAITQLASNKDELNLQVQNLKMKYNTHKEIIDWLDNKMTNIKDEL